MEGRSHRSAYLVEGWDDFAREFRNGDAYCPFFMLVSVSVAVCVQAAIRAVQCLNRMCIDGCLRTSLEVRVPDSQLLMKQYNRNRSLKDLRTKSAMLRPFGNLRRQNGKDADSSTTDSSQRERPETFRFMRSSYASVQRNLNVRPPKPSIPNNLELGHQYRVHF